VYLAETRISCLVKRDDMSNGVEMDECGAVEK
jgi:hypothetical protein